MWRGEGYKARVEARSDYFVVGGCLLAWSLCNSGFQDLLWVRPSSLLMLYGCISISVAFLMRRSMSSIDRVVGPSISELKNTIDI